MKRRDMKPGMMFVVGDAVFGPRWAWPWPEVWVVLDERTEVGFWSGARTAMGDIGPSIQYATLDEVHQWD